MLVISKPDIMVPSRSSFLSARMGLKRSRGMLHDFGVLWGPLSSASFLTQVLVLSRSNTTASFQGKSASPMLPNCPLRLARMGHA